MLIRVKEGKRNRPTPTLPPPDPPEGGKGGGLFTFYPITCS